MSRILETDVASQSCYVVVSSVLCNGTNRGLGSKWYSHRCESTELQRRLEAGRRN